MRPALLLRRVTLAALAAATPALALTATVTEADDLRSQPSQAASRLAAVHRLSTVEVLEQRRDWVRIEIGGGRSGWVRERILAIAPPPAPADPGAPTAAGSTPAQWLPRSAPRASNHALIVPLAGAGAADTAAATAIARLLGVPDANLRQPATDEAGADGLRRALAGLDARLGADDRAFIHLLAAGGRTRGDGSCDALTTAAHDTLPLAELATQLRALARKADKLVVVIDGPCGAAATRALAAPAGGNILALAAAGSGATPALLACLDGRAALVAPAGLASGDDWRRCAQAVVDHGVAGHAAPPITLGGNPALVPAPALADGSPVEPRRLLQALHAQRSERRSVSLGGLRAGYRAADTLHVTVSGPPSGHLYLIAASADGFTLLHPGPSAPRERFSGSQTLNLPARDAAGATRLLALVTDSPRNFLRAGFAGAGHVATAPADARTLRDLPLEILGGDTSPTCQRSETRNLGPTQARLCSTAFGAAIADLTISP